MEAFRKTCSAEGNRYEKDNPIKCFHIGVFLQSGWEGLEFQNKPGKSSFRLELQCFCLGSNGRIDRKIVVKLAALL